MKSEFRSKSFAGGAQCDADSVPKLSHIESRSIYIHSENETRNCPKGNRKAVSVQISLYLFMYICNLSSFGRRLNPKSDDRGSISTCHTFSFGDWRSRVYAHSLSPVYGFGIGNGYPLVDSVGSTSCCCGRFRHSLTKLQENQTRSCSQLKRRRWRILMKWISTKTWPCRSHCLKASKLHRWKMLEEQANLQPALRL